MEAGGFDRKKTVTDVRTGNEAAGNGHPKRHILVVLHAYPFFSGDVM